MYTITADKTDKTCWNVYLGDSFIGEFISGIFKPAPYCTVIPYSLMKFLVNFYEFGLDTPAS